jgi:hypothetical protein
MLARLRSTAAPSVFFLFPTLCNLAPFAIHCIVHAQFSLVQWSVYAAPTAGCPSVAHHAPAVCSSVRAPGARPLHVVLGTLPQRIPFCFFPWASCNEGRALSRPY